MVGLGCTLPQALYGRSTAAREEACRSDDPRWQWNGVDKTASVELPKKVTGGWETQATPERVVYCRHQVCTWVTVARAWGSCLITGRPGMSDRPNMPSLFSFRS